MICALVVATIRANFRERGNFYRALLGSFAFQGAQFATLSVLLQSFGTIAGWGPAQVMLLFSARLLSHALAGLVFDQLSNFPAVIQTGEFDTFLIRPFSVLLQVLSRRLSLTVVADMCAGVVILIVSMVQLPTEWTVGQAILLGIAILGGALVEGAMKLLVASLAVKYRVVNSLNTLSTDLVNEFAIYPTSVFGTTGLLTLTVIPVALISFLPLTAVLRGQVPAVVPFPVAVLSPSWGVALFAFALFQFRRSVRTYISPSG